jgi:general secretion pathway protein B
MSFILDALRKSEHARQRQTGPGLAEAPIAAAKPKANAWATAAVVLLVVNLLAVGILLLRRAQKDDAAASTAPDSPAPVARTAPGPANPTLSTPPPTVGTPVTQGAAPVRAPIDEPAGPAARNPLADELGSATGEIEASSRSAASAVPAGPPAVMKNGSARRGGTVVYAPVPEASDLPYSPPPEQRAVQQAAPPAAAMPDADEVAARGGVAALHLDLHVYATQPQQRFVFVNSRKYKEGDTLAEGPVVEQITPDGAVLNFRGSRFRLSND